MDWHFLAGFSFAVLFLLPVIHGLREQRNALRDMLESQARKRGKR